MAQRSSTTAFAKSTRPEIGGAVQREALYARLDGSPARTLAWISGPPGFGKTTLAASYLEAREFRWAWYEVDPDDDDGETFFHYLAHAVRKLHGTTQPLPAFEAEHRANLAAFARRYFRALFAGLSGPVALVLDNLHELGADSALRTILEAGLPQVPRPSCVIVTSRAPPPPGLARLQPGGQMVCITADELKITAPELAEMARLRGKPLTQEALLQLQQRADGWAAALVLMVEHHKLSASPAQLAGEATPKAVFNYFAGEIFERFEPATQRLLLQIACLPRVTIEVARALSGDDTAGRVLFNLAHNDYFVREHVGPDGRVFVFHPLLREFLLQRAARELPQALGADALRRAARLLREAGQTEDALALFIERREWPEVAAIVGEQAEAWLAQGRHAALAGWLELLPPALLAAEPALLLAHGAAIAHVSPREARRRLEAAFEAFRRSGDAAGMARAAVAVIAVVLREFDDLTTLDRWLEAYDAATGGSPPPSGTPSPVQAARMWREPGHPAIARLRAARSPASDLDAVEQAPGELARSVAALLNGDFAASAAIIDGVAAGRGAEGVALATCRSLRALLDGEPAAALAAARAGIEAGSAEAAHGQDAWLQLLQAAAHGAQGDGDAARRELEAIDAASLRRGDRAFVHFVRADLASAAGDTGTALREARSAVLLAAEAGLPWFECLARVGLSQLLAGAADRPGAEAQARAAEALAQRLGSPLLRLAALFGQAAVAMAVDDSGAAVPALQTGLALARDLGARHVPGLAPAVLASLCALALRRGIGAEHARTLIGAGRLAPPVGAARLRRWPWAFEIVTLGGFRLQRGGEDIEFSAKGPGRPVELLKVLISLGATNVRADQLADALWPHVDADYAHKSFTATLHRLRRILGEDDAVRLRDGRLSLSDSLFWLDTWALDQVLAEIEACFRDGDAAVAEPVLRALVEEALTLYKGPFLRGEVEHPDYQARREQVRSRLLRALARAARHWEAAGRGAAVVDAYQRCIDADEEYEAFYRQLMLCHQRQGDSLEALATYGRLQAVLAARLKTAPSAETQAVYARLQA